ncbi:MAG: fluoride efflux transporter CrcB [Deltaproteobacteria bacterium]|nr:MAG: fluoride efflux transporter CrcB [Deltaproteobacteria bacterium]
MIKLLAVAVGGGLGACSRYLIAAYADKFVCSAFPWATLAANLTGSLLMGVFWGCFEKIHISNEFRLFLFTGFLGGFTTFSTFARESVQLFKTGEILTAIIYITASNLLAVLLVGAGFMLSGRVFRF